MPGYAEDIDLTVLWAREVMLDETMPAQARADAQRYVMTAVLGNLTTIMEGR